MCVESVDMIGARNVCERTLNAQGFPVMDSTEKLEAGRGRLLAFEAVARQAEMSCLPLDHEALALLRRLRPQEALAVLQQARAWRMHL